MGKLATSNQARNVATVRRKTVPLVTEEKWKKDVDQVERRPLETGTVS